MIEFKINIDQKSFYINRSGFVIGDICCSVGDWYFPEKDWDDFVVTLLYWFARKLIRLKFKEEQPQEIDFMEGPFKVSIYLDEKDLCNIQLIEGEKLEEDEEIIHKEINIPFEDVKSEVKKACEILLKMKETKELDFEKDYKELKESYDLLCQC